MDLWNPEQYKKFETERARPFWDLAKKVNFENVFKVLDVGCGTGELTHALHVAHQVPQTLGIDASPKMLETTKGLKARGLSFQNIAVENFVPTEQFDLVFSNAALQWVGNHEELIVKMVPWIKPGGTLAIGMPQNFEHPSHRIAEETAAQFGLKPRPVPVLPAELYARILWNSGMSAIDVSSRVYLHPMPSVHDVVEWTKGTLLTYYEAKLNPPRFKEFLNEYSRALLRDTGEGTYLYTFKRLFIVATRD